MDHSFEVGIYSAMMSVGIPVVNFCSSIALINSMMLLRFKPNKLIFMHWPPEDSILKEAVLFLKNKKIENAAKINKKALI